VAAAGALRGGGRLKSRVRCPLPRGLGRRTGGSLTDSISQREKVVGTRLRRLGRHGEAEYFPPARNRERTGMLLAEVVTVRLCVGCKRAEDGGGVRIDVRQRGHRGLAAG
jgi:hypothetical protein